VPGERLWVIDADHWPRAFILAELTERGYDVTGFETVRAAVVRLLMVPADRPMLVLVDLHEQMADQKALDSLSRQALPTVAIAAATAAAEGALGGRAWAALLRRPLTIGAVVEVIARILSERERSRGSETSSSSKPPGR
jgi:DNA-binding NtrC family response regulator